MAGKYHWFRNPRTAQEKRHAQEGWNRLKRGLGTIPDQRDELHFNSQYLRNHRSWKRLRKTRWKDPTVKPKKRWPWLWE